MSEKDTKGRFSGIELEGEKTFEFVIDEFSPISSMTIIQAEDVPAGPLDPKEIALDPAARDSEVEAGSQVFRQLAAPKLPELSKENRAKLLMQSPNRLYFYWSVKNNPFQTLNRAIGNKTNSYVLVSKLVNLNSGREELNPIDADGSYWFNVDANSEYQAEIGFYAANRTYIRVMFSNKVQTPRKNPSPRAASTAEWAVSANKFAQVLDVAGFSQDAFDVALAGDDWDVSEKATEIAFSHFTGGVEDRTTGIESGEIRFVMLALASGATLESLRWRISPSLFAILQQSSANLNIENALVALQDQFDFDADEIIEEEISPAVFGASLINFPRTLKRMRNLTKINPVSSSDRPICATG
ncbi:MAG: DUF4912 domain-containing protein [Pyrinomonadaceae bacterium]